MSFNQNERNSNGGFFCGNDEENNNNFHCGGSGNNGLQQFHELIMAAQREFVEAGEASEQAICYASKAVSAQERSIKERQHAEALLGRAFEWLRIYGNRYDCNFDSQDCQQIARQIQCIALKIAELEGRGLEQLTGGLCLLKQAECGEKKLEYLVRKYIECIHERDRNRPCD